MREAVVVGGQEVIPAGSAITGTVAAARPSGKVKGRAQLAFRFSQIDVGGVTYDISTRLMSYEAKGTKKDDSTKIGIGAAAPPAPSRSSSAPGIGPFCLALLLRFEV